MTKLFLSLVCWLSLLGELSATVYSLPPSDSRLLGEPVSYRVESGDYFQAIAEYHDVGLLALIAANPDVDPFLPKVGQRLTIPKQMLLPYAERKGIVINLAELRLYYFPPGEQLVYVFPVGIGRQGLSTPEVVSYIGEKRKDPVWRPTQAMRARYFDEHGVELAKEIPAGPNNPFGQYAMRIGTSEYLIHGTNQRMGIGMRASSGCIRMYEPDIEWLFNNVHKGTQVRIINQAIKMSYERDGQKLIEVHRPLSEQGALSMDTLSPAVSRFIGEEPQHQQQLAELIKQPNGIVVPLQ
ncbi:L,D-transpeptidase family protein [Thalassotalea sp. G2M2-11]|uniref:L,D-transpeptidase family protein n=1 Tax=Thalassotalea sp. G2M2-11 TaxID=2787627 RepID=UPI0019D24DAC|nr:L,D-transpeptidase family protein [Thalassotalea sp. G2M2-11]